MSYSKTTFVTMNEPSTTEFWCDGKPKARVWALPGHWSLDALKRRASRYNVTIAAVRHHVYAPKGRSGHDGLWLADENGDLVLVQKSA